MNRKIVMAIALSVLLVPLGANAQYEVNDYVISSGGHYTTGSHTVRFTLCQTGYNYTTGPSNTVDPGFWNICMLTSALEVTVSSVSCERVEGAVVLSWTAIADGDFAGFNVYRADEEASEEFIRINREGLLPPGEKREYRDETVLPDRTYLYRIGAVQDGRETMSTTVTITLPPMEATLYQNYPNPFNPSTRIEYYIPGRSMVRLEIFDVKGRLVKTLVSGIKPEGEDSVLWNGTNRFDESVSSGVYYYRLRAGKKNLVRKLVLLR